MLIDLLKKNRSYRGYDMTRKVSREEMLRIVDSVRYAPSSVNLQPLKYYIAYEEEKVALIQSMTKWAAGLPQLHLPYDGKCPTAFVVICNDTSIAPNTVPFLKDVGIVAQTMLLTATEMDLGGCMIGNFKPEEVKAKLELADNLDPVLVVAIGKPDEEIVLTDVGEDGNTRYYRDENNVHYVPKRSLEDIII